MKQSQAKKETLNNSKTWRELKETLDQASKEGQSIVNTALTKQQVADILRNMFKGKDLNKIPDLSCFNTRRNRVQLSGLGLGVVNLLREFG